MSRYRNVRYGRTFLVELEPGEDVLLNVEEAVRQAQVTDAVFLAGIGDLKCCHSHFAAKQENGKYMTSPWSGRTSPSPSPASRGLSKKGRLPPARSHRQQRGMLDHPLPRGLASA